MKPRIYTSVLMFISAYTPLFVIFGIRDFDFETTHRLKHPLYVAVMLAIVLLSNILLFCALKALRNADMSVKITQIKNRSVDLFNYSVLYVICFFAIDLSKMGDVISMAFFLVVMLWLTITTNSVFLNPILSMAGYGLYDVDCEFDNKQFSMVILTRQKLITDSVYHVISISRFLYLIK